MIKIYIWVRTKSFLWWNNEEQPQITWEVTMSGTGSMLCACATGSFAKPQVGPFHRKWRQWPEVIVCACATGIFYITTRVVVQVHSYRRSGRVCAISPLWGLLTGSWLQEVTSFSPRIFLSGSTTCWLVVFSTTFASTPFPGYLSFYFHNHI